MYPPARIVSTTLPGIAGRADESTKGGVFNDVLTPVRDLASKVANEGVESTGSGRPLSGGGGRPVPIAGEAKSGAFCKNVRTASELVTAERERSTVRSCLWYYPTPPMTSCPPRATAMGWTRAWTCPIFPLGGHAGPIPPLVEAQTH